MSNTIRSDEAVRLSKLLWSDSYRYGPHHEFQFKNETMTVMLSAKRCYIYGEQRKAMISHSRRSIENIENLTEQDVIDVLRWARMRQEEICEG